MKVEEFDEILSRTLDDRRISRGERKALRALLADEPGDSAKLAEFRRRAFAIANEHIRDPRNKEIVVWLEDVLKLLLPPEETSKPKTEALFSPGRACCDRLVALFDASRSGVDVCVYTITDDRIADAIARAHRRRVPLRILTDVSKSHDPGSDIDRFEELGIPVVVDTADKYMHNKFAVFDSAILVTGSYNWTRSAARRNEENIVVSDEPGLVRAFSAEFQRLWNLYGP